MAAISDAMEVQYNKALVRAQAENIFVRRLSVNSVNSWIATNPTSKQQYLVTQRGAALECSCPAGQNGNYCKHRAAVRFYVVCKNERATKQLAKLQAEREETQRAAEELAEQERLNWMGMSRNERAAWLLANA
jgi:hypothetical protein